MKIEKPEQHLDHLLRTTGGRARFSCWKVVSPERYRFLRLSYLSFIAGTGGSALLAAAIILA